MVNYWKHQAKVDIVAALAVTAIFWTVSALGFTPLLVVSDESVISSARSWVGPTLTLLGLMATTTAFISSTVDRDEFKQLRTKGAESQLWQIFSENLFWLTVASLSAVAASFARSPIPQSVLTYLTFLIAIVAICVVKFTWVMRQVIAVRISNTKK